MALKSYIITKTCQSPVVQVTGVPHSPQAIRYKTFRVGEIIKGELKHANNKPALILVAGRLVVPISCANEITSKEITSNASGSSSSDKPAAIQMPSINKVKYIDVALLGIVAGIGATYLAEKQGWISNEDKKNKIYGAAIGAVISIYALYRYKAYLKEKPKEKE